MSDTPETRPPRGLARDFHRARDGAKASGAELREYVRQFRGKNPQEMLGLVAGSSLIQGTILATIFTIILMAGFTVGPYVWKKTMAQPVAKIPPPKPAATSGPAAAAPTTLPVSSVPATTGTAAPPSVAPRDPVLDRLGIGEVKMSEPKKSNPLDAGSDDLLKDIK